MRFGFKREHLASVIKPQILASIALKNLTSKRLRTSLTIGGIIIGVGAVVFLVSLATGLHGVVNQQVVGSRSVKTIDVTSPNNTVIQLNNTNVNKMKQFAHVTQVAPAYILPGKISDQGSLTDAVVYGVGNYYLSLSALKVVAGHNYINGNKEVILSQSLLSLIGQSNASRAIGQKVNVDTTITLPDGTTKQFNGTLKVAGVVNIGGGVAVYMSREALLEAGAAQYGQVKVVADSRGSVPTIRNQIAGLGLTTASPLDTLSEINNIFTIFTFVVIGFGGIGMIIAILGMFNTLTISLIERTSEIGLMITMGARNADVQRLLIFEALLLSVIGGLGGIFFAGLLGVVINLILTHFASLHGVQGTIHAFNVTPLMILATIIFILLVGFVVAFYPSRRAAKINPIDALRHE